MIAFFFYGSVLLIKGERNGIIKYIISFLNRCSQYSLQIYLFNGFLLVPIRVLTCNVLHVMNPLVIVIAIVASNILISLLACEVIKNQRFCLIFVVYLLNN